MTLPNLSGKATLDTSEFRQGIKTVRADLAAVQELGKRMGTIRLTADLSAAKDVQKATRAIRDAIQESLPTDMQRRIDDTFGAFSLGANSAKQSAAVFEAQASALRARIDELDRAVKITRADFQAGFGEATPQETAKLSVEMARLSRELEKVGTEARENFGEYSREAQKVANANRLAQTTAAAARGEITRLGLASQVKLGVGSALQQYGSQAGLAANNIFGLAKASDSARIAQGLFGKTIEKTGQDVGVAAETVNRLQDTLGLTADTAREGIRGLLRQGFTLEQAYTSLEGAGASALAAGRSAADGVDALVDAVTSGTSARLNEIGVSENLSTFLQREAKARNTTVDALDKQARAQAAVNLITAATSDEVGDLSALLGGVSGNLSGTSRAFDEAGKKLGEAFIPLLTNGIRIVTKFLDVFNDLPEVGKNTVAILGASAVAVGFLAGPVSNLAKGYATIRDGLKGVKAASDGLASGAQALGEGADNIAQNADAYTNLAEKARTFYASTSARLTTYISNTLLATGATTVFSRAFLTAVANTTLFTTALGAVTVGLVAAVAGVAALAAGVGYFSVKLIKETQAIYDQIDEANQSSFDATMKRVAALTKEGTELSRAQARVLIIQQQLSDAQQGDLVGVTAFGERIYKVNEEAVARYQGALVDARGEVTRLFTEAQRRGQLNLKLTEDQTKAVRELQRALEGRAFNLKIEGLSDMQADLARVGRDFAQLREEFKKPFVVEGKLMDPAQTPALRQGLAQLDAGQEAERASIRKRYADEALDVAKRSAVEVQDAEIAAMREGQAKKTALRQQELLAVQRDADERIAALADFPEQQQQLEEDTRQIIAAKRRGWAEEDRQLTIDNGRRVVEAENRAASAVIEGMEDGLAKREALRAQELASVRRDVADRVAALAGDAAAQAGVQAAGELEIAAKQSEQNRARLAEARETARLIVDAETSARDGTIAAMADGRVKREAIRAAELLDLKASIAEKVAALADDPEAQGRVQAAGDRQLAAKRLEQDRQRVAEVSETEKLVQSARDTARAAEIAAIQDEGQKRQAEREKELADFQQTLTDRLEALRDYPAQQQAVLEAAQQQARALQQRYAQEDALEATARAQRIADAYLKAQDAQFAAEQAGRDNQAARYELDLARRLARVEDNAVQTAEIEAEALGERARLVEAAAQAQYLQDQQRLVSSRDRALSDTKLSADERTAIWREYYANLNQLSGAFQAGEKQRLVQQENDARQAAEAVRLARVGEANRPVEQSQSRVQELQQSRDLAASDAELFIIAQQISAEREKQLTLLSQQLAGLGGVNLTAQERAAVEEKIRSIQHDQALALKDQQAQQQSLRVSALDRRDAEAQYAEKVARTAGELEAARQKQLAVAQARLRELDGQIAAEGQEEKRNALVAQRFILLGQIADLTQQEASAPIDADERRLKLYQAQAQTRLIANGLADNEAATAQLTLQIAAQELLIANRRVEAAGNQLALEAAQTEQAQARLAFAQAYAAAQSKVLQAPTPQPLSAPSISAPQDPRKRQQELRQQALDDLGRELELQNKLQDVAEARSRGLAQLAGSADDAVASAALELRLTRERLDLTEAQLSRDDLGAAGRAALGQKRIELLLKEEEQQRKLNETRLAAARLTEVLELAEGRLAEALAGGSAESNRVTVATRQIAESRRVLTAAERDYAQARRDAEQVGSSANLEKLKTATDAVADAVGNHRSAVRNLANEYRTLISQMDGVRDAGDKLRQVAYGDTAPFNAAREQERLAAIAQRRDAAQRELAQALSGGQPEQIARATEELTRQQERYTRQIEVLGKNGVRVSDLGQRETQRLSNVVDALGIQYDREAVTLAERARIIDQEAENALTLQGAAETFDAGTDRLVAALESTVASLTAALQQDSLERQQQTLVDREIAGRVAAPAVPTLPPRVVTAPVTPFTFDLRALDQLASRLAPPKLPEVQPVMVTGDAARSIGREVGREVVGSLASARPSATAPINNYAGDTYHLTVNGAPGQSPEVVADIAIRKLEDRARRSGRRCPP
ncbi:hypothetical protein [Deinococcus radiopugnans]|uniref:Uncharacterized protein n=2 Tax=Deinococcus radiopugnans TaxID=57497 RepID=A0A5C4Y8U7_9DEIO|nr:hypothetical protein [Deinococcus radiopugnans]MBB6016807.1 hypothetical protein [Deinococcus radiopugnans ATCC 19172]TNM71904.1 hypothetical protein FHR04_05925 [Deinococcus radiopugnans ATCC 19172]